MDCYALKNKCSNINVIINFVPNSLRKTECMNRWSVTHILRVYVHKHVSM